ncbi:MAG: transposase [Sandaracinaceae bacterium]|nr:transposase [Sandaracinaceae bacterium]
MTSKVRPGVWRLRAKKMFNRIWHALRVARERLGARIVHYSVQNDHVHLIVEAESREALSRAMQGLAVRVARALNRVMGRKGKVFADRFHERVLATPKETSHSIQYVLGNAKKHGIGPRAARWVDGMSSASWFGGWRGEVRFELPECAAGGAGPPTAAPRTWLLAEGWRRAGAPLTAARRSAASS